MCVKLVMRTFQGELNDEENPLLCVYLTEPQRQLVRRSCCVSSSWIRRWWVVSSRQRCLEQNQGTLLRIGSSEFRAGQMAKGPSEWRCGWLGLGGWLALPSPHKDQAILWEKGCRAEDAKVELRAVRRIRYLLSALQNAFVDDTGKIECLECWLR